MLAAAHSVAHWLASSPWAHLAELQAIVLAALHFFAPTRSRRSGRRTRNARPAAVGVITPASMRAGSASTRRHGHGGTLTFEQLSRTVTPTKHPRGFRQPSLSTVWIASVGGGACINPGSGPNGDAA